MNKTNIEWCDSTWNPITGCKHACEYCYAREISRRFEGVWNGDNNSKLHYLPVYDPIEVTGAEFDGYGLKYRVGNDKSGRPKLINAPYPYGFHPTLHRHRIEAGIQRWKKPRTIFVGSMTDLFGKWVPDDWIMSVFKACEAAPQHRYMFLTKNPARYTKLHKKGILPGGNNYWFGSTITTDEQEAWFSDEHNVFWSIEPIQSRFDCEITIEAHCDFVIIGAETGNRRGKIIPKREWVQGIVNACRAAGVPVFLKNNLCKIWGEPLIQELPWEAAI